MFQISGSGCVALKKLWHLDLSYDNKSEKISATSASLLSLEETTMNRFLPCFLVLIVHNAHDIWESHFKIVTAHATCNALFPYVWELRFIHNICIITMGGRGGAPWLAIRDFAESREGLKCMLLVFSICRFSST